jgi:hypothetical protein
MDPLNVYDLCYNKFWQKTNMLKKIGHAPRVRYMAMVNGLKSPPATFLNAVIHYQASYITASMVAFPFFAAM